jgi:glycogen synthase
MVTIVSEHINKVISSAVDTELFKPKGKSELRAKYGLPVDGKVACWVGSTHRIKGIQVVSDLTSRFRDIHWILVFKDRYGRTSGSINSIRGRLSVYRRWKVKGRISVLGRLQPQELSEIYSLSDFAVLP